MSSLEDIETLASLFLLPDAIVVEAVSSTKSRLTLQISCTHTSASCPLCQQSSERIHGRYGRTVADVPCAGRLVTLAFTIRKFVCHTTSCPRRIFTERLPELVQSYARMTNRLSESLQTLGFATCGELGERFAPKLGMQVSGPTLLRRMRARSYTPPASVSVLGIDDWAWKKGATYGTILVDLQSHKPIELLPDRTTETAEAWLRIHPEVDIVSRDRGGEYATAAKKGAPQAQQVADRFHLLQNLRERLKDLMERKQSCLPEVAKTPSDAIPQKTQGIKDFEATSETTQEKHYRKMSPDPYQPSEEMTYNVQRTQVLRENRSARYEAVRALHQQGFSIRAISRRLEICRVTIRRFLQAEKFPEKSKPPKRGSILNPYKPYLLQRWQEGCWNGVQLYDEIKARGYTGSGPLLRIFLADLRKKHQETGDPTALILDISGTRIEVPPGLPPQPHIKNLLSPTRASWLFIRQSEKLDEKEHRYVEQIRQGHLDLETAYQLGQGFVMMLAERRGGDLDNWLTQAEHSSLPEFKKMAKGIRLDYGAVKAAFSSKWSQGQVEAQVNCLKLQKRIVFGRANFDLLRLRVLCRI